MEVSHSHLSGTSLHISSDVIEKIAQLATLEIEGVDQVAMGTASSASGLRNKIVPQKPIKVEMNDGVADIEVCLVAKYGTKIPTMSEQVQRNVKNSVQNMTSITVAKVDIVVTGISPPNSEPVAEN